MEKDSLEKDREILQLKDTIDHLQIEKNTLNASEDMDKVCSKIYFKC